MSKFVMDEIDCLDNVASNLHDLLDVICDLQLESGPKPDRRVDSLLWIARDMSQAVVDKIGADAKKRRASK